MPKKHPGAAQKQDAFMKVTVCELPNNWTDNTIYWNQLIQHLAEAGSDLLLLPEMPFFEWITRSDNVNSLLWKKAVTAHEAWVDRLEELPVDIIIGSRPVLSNGIPLNNGFVYQKGKGLLPVHDKYYLPDEPGYYEASWYKRGDGHFDLVTINGVNIGFLICTELWFTVQARHYMKQGIDILVCPRATPLTEVDIWVTGGKAAAIVSGAYCLSSNYNGPNTEVEDFGGTGWIIEPERGDIMGLTEAGHWLLTQEIDIERAKKAKKTYPRYVKE